MSPIERDTQGLIPAMPEGNSGATDLSWVAQDRRLTVRAIAAADAMGIERLQELIVDHARFDHPATVTESDGIQRPSPHHGLELLLNTIPTYMAYAKQAGVTPDQAYGLVRIIQTAEGRSEWGLIDEPVAQLSRVFKGYVDRKQTLSERDYATLQKLVEDTTDKEDDNKAVIDAYRALTQIGMSATEVDALIRNELFTDSLVINYALQPLNALSVAGADSRVLQDICRLIPGDEPFLPDIQASYTILHDLITTVCPGRDMPPRNLLDIVRNRLAEGQTMADIAAHFVAGSNRAVEGGAAVYLPAERRARHFIDTAGPLELSPLPYRNERSFSDGAADIGRIALHDPRHREAVGEGVWVYDAGVPTWYSLGGETEVDIERGAVQAHYPLYPLGDLSHAPVLYHAHPTALEHAIGLRPNQGLFPNIAASAVTKFLAATPSRQDYAMVAELMRSPEYQGGEVRSFIAHGTGTTEYIFPQDPDALEEMGRMSQVLRDDMLARINWDRILFNTKWRGLVRGARKNTDEVVRELVGRFDTGLPKGFQLRFLGLGMQVTL